MIRKRKIPIAVAVALVAMAIVAAVLLRRQAAPEPARLLPEADGYVYVNLKPLRAAGVIGKNVPVSDDPGYTEFVRDTGFEFERDLDEAAFAVHAPPRLVDTDEPPKGGDDHQRFSEVFTGRIDSNRMTAYLQKIAKGNESYRDITVYSIPLQGRTVRVALLGAGIAAVSNTDGPGVIHGMIDRYKQIALPFGGPDLIREYYRHVPFASLAWGIMKLGSDANGSSGLSLPGGFDLFFPNDTVLVGSARYVGSVQFRAEAFASGAEQAKRISQQSQAFLSIFRGLQESTDPRGPDPDVKAFFDSLKVEQNDRRVVLTATAPPGFLKKTFGGPPTNEITGTAGSKHAAK